jgi:hypothetical protein
MKQLMLAHAFSLLRTWCSAIGENNIRSRKRQKKIGAIKNGIEEGLWKSSPSFSKVCD